MTPAPVLLFLSMIPLTACGLFAILGELTANGYDYSWLLDRSPIYWLALTLVVQLVAVMRGEVKQWNA